MDKSDVYNMFIDLIGDGVIPSRRDLFAAAALMGIRANDRAPAVTRASADTLAKEAFLIADAMMGHR